MDAFFTIFSGEWAARLSVVAKKAKKAVLCHIKGAMTAAGLSTVSAFRRAQYFTFTYDLNSEGNREA